MRAEEGARGRVAAAAAAVAVTRSALLSDPTEREDFCAEKIRRWPTRREGGRQGGDVRSIYTAASDSICQKNTSFRKITHLSI